MPFSRHIKIARDYIEKTFGEKALVGGMSSDPTWRIEYKYLEHKGIKRWYTQVGTHVSLRTLSDIRRGLRRGANQICVIMTLDGKIFPIEENRRR